jgi:hypothetical protein
LSEQRHATSSGGSGSFTEGERGLQDLCTEIGWGEKAWHTWHDENLMCVRRWQLTGVATTAMGGRVACMALFIGECRGIFGQAGGTCMWAHSELCIGCMCALQQAGAGEAGSEQRQQPATVCSRHGRGSSGRDLVSMRLFKRHGWRPTHDEATARA